MISALANCSRWFWCCAEEAELSSSEEVSFSPIDVNYGSADPSGRYTNFRNQRSPYRHPPLEHSQGSVAVLEPSIASKTLVEEPSEEFQDVSLTEE